MPSHPRPRVVAALVMAGSLVAVAGCDTGDGKVMREPVYPLPATTTTTVVPETLPPAVVDDGQAVPFQVYAPWIDGGDIPAANTCDGADQSPLISWTGVPDGTVELAIAVVDVDAGNFVHWLVGAIEPSTQIVPEGAAPEGAIEWTNSFGERGWSGPCPPFDDEHDYLFTVYALNQQVEAADDLPGSEVLTMLASTEIAHSTVTGQYLRTSG